MMTAVARSGAAGLALAPQNAAGNRNEGYNAGQCSFELLLRSPMAVPPLSDSSRDPVRVHDGSPSMRDSSSSSSSAGNAAATFPNKFGPPADGACDSAELGGRGSGGGDVGAHASPLADLLRTGGEPSFELRIPSDGDARSPGSSSPRAGSSSDARQAMEQQRQQQRALAMHELEMSMPTRPPYDGYRPFGLSSARNSARNAGKRANRPTHDASSDFSLDGSPARPGDSSDSFSRLLFRSCSISGGWQARADGILGHLFSGEGGRNAVDNSSGGGGGSSRWASDAGPSEYSGRAFAALGDTGNRNNSHNRSSHSSNNKDRRGKADLHLYREQSFDPNRDFSLDDRMLVDPKPSPAASSANFFRSTTAARSEGGDPGDDGEPSARATVPPGAVAWEPAVAAVAATAAVATTGKPSAAGTTGAYDGFGNDDGPRRSPSFGFADHDKNDISPEARVAPSLSPLLPREQSQLLPIPSPPAPIPAHPQDSRRYNLLAMMIPTPDISKFGGGSGSRPAHGAGHPGPAGLRLGEGSSPTAAAVDRGEDIGAVQEHWTRQAALSRYRRKKLRRGAALWRWKNDPDLVERSKSRVRSRAPNGRFQGRAC